MASAADYFRQYSSSSPTYDSDVSTSDVPVGSVAIGSTEGGLLYSTPGGGIIAGPDVTGDRGIASTEGGVLIGHSTGGGEPSGSSDMPVLAEAPEDAEPVASAASGGIIYQTQGGVLVEGPGASLDTSQTPLDVSIISGQRAEDIQFWGGAGEGGFAATPEYLRGGKIIQEEGEGAYKRYYILGREGKQVFGVNVYGMNVYGTQSAGGLRAEGGGALPLAKDRQPTSTGAEMSFEPKFKVPSLLEKLDESGKGDVRMLEVKGGDKLFVSGPKNVIVGGEFGGRSLSAQEASMLFIPSIKGAKPRYELKPRFEAGKVEESWVDKQSEQFQRFYGKYALGKELVDLGTEQTLAKAGVEMDKLTGGFVGGFESKLGQLETVAWAKMRLDKPIDIISAVGVSGTRGLLSIPGALAKTYLIGTGYLANIGKAAVESPKFTLKAFLEGAKGTPKAVAISAAGIFMEPDEEGNMQLSAKAAARFFGSVGLLTKGAYAIKTKLGEMKIQKALAPKGKAGATVKGEVISEAIGKQQKFGLRAETTKPFEVTFRTRQVKVGFGSEVVRGAGEVYSPPLVAKYSLFYGKARGPVGNLRAVVEMSSRAVVESKVTPVGLLARLRRAVPKVSIDAIAGGKEFVQRMRTPRWQLKPTGEAVFELIETGPGQTSAILALKRAFFPVRRGGAEFKVVGVSEGGPIMAYVQRLGGKRTPATISDYQQASLKPTSKAYAAFLEQGFSPKAYETVSKNIAQFRARATISYILGRELGGTVTGKKISTVLGEAHRVDIPIPDKPPEVYFHTHGRGVLKEPAWPSVVDITKTGVADVVPEVIVSPKGVTFYSKFAKSDVLSSLVDLRVSGALPIKYSSLKPPGVSLSLKGVPISKVLKEGILAENIFGYKGTVGKYNVDVLFKQSEFVEAAAPVVKGAPGGSFVAAPSGGTFVSQLQVQAARAKPQPPLLSVEAVKGATMSFIKLAEGVSRAEAVAAGQVAGGAAATLTISQEKTIEKGIQQTREQTVQLQKFVPAEASDYESKIREAQISISKQQPRAAEVFKPATGQPMAELLKQEARQPQKFRESELLKQAQELKQAELLKQPQLMKQALRSAAKTTVPTVAIPLIPPPPPFGIPRGSSPKQKPRFKPKIKYSRTKRPKLEVAPFADYFSKTITEARTRRPAKSPSVARSQKEFLKSYGQRVPTAEMIKWEEEKKKKGGRKK